MVEWVKEEQEIQPVLMSEVRAECRELQIMLNAKGVQNLEFIIHLSIT